MTHSRRTTHNPLLSVLLAGLCLGLLPTLLAQPPKSLDIYFIDTEGGQSTLVVTPSGQSLLIDAGFPGDRDAERIVSAAKLAGVTSIDHLLITHHHGDHEGGVPDLLERMPVRAVLDHGPSVEADGRRGPGATPETSRQAYDAYVRAVAALPRRAVVPGDRIEMAGLDILVVTSAEKFINERGAPNPFCEGLSRHDSEPVPWENPQSVGIVLQFGRFRFVDLGDLTWNSSLGFFCPANRIAPIDLYLSPHHGTAETPKAEWAMRPRVTVMNNGASKGGDPRSWRTLRDSPGLEDLWQLHFSLAGGADHNVQERFIANLEGGTDGHYLRASASEDGSFTIFNARTGETKRYAARERP
jgi:competence protein ComEC